MNKTLANIYDRLLGRLVRARAAAKQLTEED